MLRRSASLCVGLGLVALAAPGLRAQTLDQVCDPVDLNYGYLMVPERGGSTAAGDELYQNFVPSVTPLVKVDVKSPVRGPTMDPAILRVRILDPFVTFANDQNQLGSETLSVQTTPGFPTNTWVEVTFSQPIMVVPGNTYTIAMSWEGSGVSLWWYGADGDPYPAADPDPADLIPDDKLLDVDWAFRTYSP